MGRYLVFFKTSLLHRSGVALVTFIIHKLRYIRVGYLVRLQTTQSQCFILALIGGYLVTLIETFVFLKTALQCNKRLHELSQRDSIVAKGIRMPTYIGYRNKNGEQA